MDDWRLHVTLARPEHARALGGRLEADELSDELAHELGDAVAISHDGPELFLYSGTHAAARAAEQVVRADLAKHGWEGRIELSRWHEAEEQWEPADAPEAATAAEREAEHRKLIAREDAETAADDEAAFEVRAALPSRRAAHDLSEQLDREGVPNARRWRYVFLVAADEDAADAWARRLRGEAPEGTEVVVQGTFEDVERGLPTPFKAFAQIGGGLP